VTAELIYLSCGLNVIQYFVWLRERKKRLKEKAQFNKYLHVLEKRILKLEKNSRL